MYSDDIDCLASIEAAIESINIAKARTRYSFCELVDELMDELKLAHHHRDAYLGAVDAAYIAGYVGEDAWAHLSCPLGDDYAIEITSGCLAGDGWLTVQQYLWSVAAFGEQDARFDEEERGIK